MTVLSVTGIRKVYNDVVAVDEVSFDVNAGEIVGLLGPNGAGKTTTINMILGVLEPTAGTIRIKGCDLVTHRRDALARTNFAAVYAPVPGNLTVAQNLRFFGLLYGVTRLAERIDTLIAQFDLDRFRNVKCGVLSSGEQTRVSLAKAMLNRPTLLLLDEPTASLDPDTADWVRSRLERYRDTVEEVCDRVLFLSHGRILLEGNPKTLPSEHGKDTLEELFITVAREPLTLEP
ncbi:MAG: ABC transporter ATP-binding protein [Acidobacteria bacterium]|nr:MAG: ABC transporter ATP-binding protein [Acidobacteriota bacterium]